MNSSTKNNSEKDTAGTGASSTSLTSAGCLAWEVAGHGTAAAWLGNLSARIKALAAERDDISARLSQAAMELRAAKEQSRNLWGVAHDKRVEHALVSDEAPTSPLDEELSAKALEQRAELLQGRVEGLQKKLSALTGDLNACSAELPLFWKEVRARHLSDWLARFREAAGVLRQAILDAAAARDVLGSFGLADKSPNGWDGILGTVMGAVYVPEPTDLRWPIIHPQATDYEKAWRNSAEAAAACGALADLAAEVKALADMARQPGKPGQ